MESKTIKIALAGNPNSGKTTLFNALTGASQQVGNWPGVTVEKKEGKLKRHDGVIVTDLPGIYSLSPYTLEEVVARNYLVGERPDVILNIVDGTNIERNLYLTTQLIELGIPVIVAVNMMDVVRKRGDEIDTKGLSRALGCPVIEISALRMDGILEAAELAISAAHAVEESPLIPRHIFSGEVEHAIAHIEEAAVHELPLDQQRWYAIKIFERDEKVLGLLELEPALMAHIEKDIRAVENICDDDAESIITNERYLYVTEIVRRTYRRKHKGISVSERIDRIVTHRIAALPIFAAIMFLVYFIAVSTIGTWATDWANDGLFGSGFRMFGIGTSKYEAAVNTYASEHLFTAPFLDTLNAAKDADVLGAKELHVAAVNGDFFAFDEAYGSYGAALTEAGYDLSLYDAVFGEGAAGVPDPADFGAWIPGVPVVIGAFLDNIGCAEWLESLILDGIIGGVGAVLGFVPQMVVLFLLLSFLESCGYMSRIAFVLDRLFRKFGLSGKSFIPILVGIGCGVPGVMASRTVENERDRRMTIMTTTFIPCGAKLPVISLVATSLFGGAWWVAGSAYLLGMFAIVLSGLILKKTKLFAGDPAPFVMELPAYHLPTVGNLLRPTWERSSSFVKKAGTVILLSTVLIWLGTKFGDVGGHFGFSTALPLSDSVLGKIGGAFKWIFAPLGFGMAETTIATFMGLLAKEEIVAVFGVLDFLDMSRVAAYSFLMFNLLCAPCFAAMAAIRREMNSAKWTAFALGYQTIFAYVLSFIFYQIGSLFSGSYPGGIMILGLVLAILLIALLIFLVVRPDQMLRTKREASAKRK